MTPPRALALVLAAAVFLVATVPAAAPARAPRPRCTLAGPNLAKSRTIDVARRVTETHERLVGCVRPFGRVRVLAEVEVRELGDSGTNLAAVAGTWVLVGEHASNQYGGGSSLRAVDVRTGRAYGVHRQHAFVGDPPPSPGLNAYAINPRGFTAIVLSDLDPHRRPGTNPTVVARRVVLIAPTGVERQLDATSTPADIDPASLILDHRTVLWTHGGAVRYARF